MLCRRPTGSGTCSITWLRIDGVEGLARQIGMREGAGIDRHPELAPSLFCRRGARLDADPFAAERLGDDRERLARATADVENAVPGANSQPTHLSNRPCRVHLHQQIADAAAFACVVTIVRRVECHSLFSRQHRRLLRQAAALATQDRARPGRSILSVAQVAG